MRSSPRAAALALVLALAGLAVPAASAQAATFAPPAGRVLTGIAGDREVAQFTDAVGHPAVYQEFTSFARTSPYDFAPITEGLRSRMMLHLSTADTREVVTPRGISRGEADAYLLGLNRSIAAAGRPVYVRAMAEMNGY